jgi:hypothetical protein
MNYRCPLCLTTLDETESLSRFCLKHPQKEATFSCDQRALRENLFCPGTGEDKLCNATIEPVGVYLAHVGCVAGNPFFEGAEPDSSVQHWEVNLLREIAGLRGGKHRREMWFPLMLLRATAELDASGRRVGSLVGLVGVRSVGKTVLAMQALDKQGYVGDAAGRDVELSDYIFSRKFGDEHRLFETLRLRHRMKYNKPTIFLPRGNPNVIGDLKTVFISPAPPAGAQSEGDAPGNLVRDAGSFIFKAVADIGKAFLDPEGNWDRTSPPFWRTLAFYDTAGEASETDDPILMPIERAADRAAILIDAREIFEGVKDQEESSVAVAVQRLQRLRSFSNLRGALVVTKVDTVWGKMSADEREQVIARAEDLVEFPHNFSAERALLHSWLGKNRSENNRELAACLRRQRDEPVFFVWTENLPTSHEGGRQSVQPTSHGLARFVCWCLDVPWSELNLEQV